MSNKAILKTMIGHLIDKNQKAAQVSLHNYLASKIQTSLGKVSKMNESVQKSHDDTYTSPDGKVVITMDFADPTEREAQIWYQAQNENEVKTIQSANERWIDEVLSLYDVSLQDADMNGSESDIEGGIAHYLEFPSEEYDDDEN